MYHLMRNIIQRSSRDVLRQEKRYAGHSKWANIRHTKAENDNEKSSMIQLFVKRMRVAIVEGKSARPLDNPRLAQIIREAKKKYVPLATINSTLEKAEKSKIKPLSEVVDFRGPGNSKFAVKIISDNIHGVKMNLNTIFRKCNCKAGDGKIKNIFQHQGYILTEIKNNLDSAIDDAITVGAEEVDEIEDNEKYYKFICDPEHVGKVATQLKKLEYEIVTADDELLPKVTTTLDEETLKSIEKLYIKLGQIEEIVSVYHNIEMEDQEESISSKA